MDKKFLRDLIRYTVILFGIFLMSNGIVLLVQANLGVNPWNVFHLGISYRTGFTLGQVLQGVGILLILFSFFLGIKPRIGTFLNMLFLGLFVDLINAWGYILTPELLWNKILFIFIGEAVLGFGTALYISGNRGAGPRDSLMLALNKISSLRIGIVRGLMEVVVTIAGYILGGPLGIGTIIHAMTIGFSLEMSFLLIKIIKATKLYHLIWLDKSTKPTQTEGV